MDANTLVGWLLLAAPILATAGGLVGAALVRNYQPARQVAVAGADYVDAVADAVEYAEKYGVTNRIPGAAKFAIAIKQMDKWCDEQGLEGDGKRLTMERVQADIELMRLRLFPRRAA